MRGAAGSGRERVEISMGAVCQGAVEVCEEAELAGRVLASIYGRPPPWMQPRGKS